MTQEIKLKLEEAARSSPAAGDLMISVFKRGAQTILENPAEWGLVNAQWKEDAIHNADTGVEIAAERDRYREALESVDEDLVFLEDCAHHAEGDIATIARKKIEEALKQQ